MFTAEAVLRFLKANPSRYLSAADIAKRLDLNLDYHSNTWVPNVSAVVQHLNTLHRQGAVSAMDGFYRYQGD